MSGGSPHFRKDVATAFSVHLLQASRTLARYAARSFSNSGLAA
jgi:hypothetical protein